MMKQVKIKLPQRALTLAGGMLLTVGAFAQSGTKWNGEGPCA